MAQVKVYGRKEFLWEARASISDAIHSAVVEAFLFPVDKRFHRFLGLNTDDFIHPADRTDKFLIIEISIFEGRSVEAKKKLIRLMFERVSQAITVPVSAIEITIFETPKANWGLRGLPGDELSLDYKVNV